MSTYSFETHSKSSQIRVLNVKDGGSHLISQDAGASDPIWIAEDEILYLKGGDNGCTMIMTQRVADGSEYVIPPLRRCYERWCTMHAIT